VLTRQGLPHQSRTDAQVAAIRRGGYVLRDTDDLPELILIATGSEVGLAVQAAEILTGLGRAVRVVSMPSAEIFAAQDAGYRDAVLPPQVTRRVAIEAGVSAYWCPWVGARGRVIGIDRFGASAPAKDLFAHFGFTTEHVVDVAESMW
jgi:transketolase